MEPFDELLRGVRADGAGVNRVEVAGAREFRGGLMLFAVASGEIRVAGRTAKAGDIVVAREALAVEGQASLVSGTYDVMGAVARRLTAVLPPTLVAEGSEKCAWFYDSVDTDSGVAADRLLDWLMVCGLRGWFDREHGDGWLAALGDGVVGPVLRAMHARPERPWTLALLAKEAGVARTTLAGRFARLVGVPPLTYLTEWRMAAAADLLADSTATVASVARRVGYADAFGFSVAFKRVHGFSPSECRSRCAVSA